MKKQITVQPGITWRNKEASYDAMELEPSSRQRYTCVIYFKQGTDQKAKEQVKQWTVQMTDSVLSVKGTWYLPYQPHATLEQFQKGYPGAEAYFAVKQKFDPASRFTNKQLDKYQS